MVFFVTGFGHGVGLSQYGANQMAADGADYLEICLLYTSVDRNALAELAGVTAQAAEGLIPPGVPGNGGEDFRTSGGALLDNENYAERCQEARRVLSEAGYSGAGLGELEYLYVEDGNTGAVAQALCRQWKDCLLYTSRCV